MELVPIVNLYTNETMTLVQQTSFGPHTNAGTIYENVVHSFLMLAAPLLLLIIFTILMVFNIRRIRRNNELSRSQKKMPERRITVVMLAVMTICVICHVPERVYSIFKAAAEINATGCSTGDSTDQNSVIMFVLAYIVNLLIVLNSTINFLVYYILRKKFRQNMVLLCCHRCASDKYLRSARRQISSKVQHLTIKTNSFKHHGRLQQRGSSIDSITSFSTLSPMSVNTAKSTSTPQTATSTIAFTFKTSNQNVNSIISTP